jgi:hypothetical protein
MDNCSYYEQILDISRQMLAAGLAQAWDDLIALEDRRRMLFAQAEKPVPRPDDAQFIREIQKCDAELTQKVDAWMTHARILLREPNP